MLTRIMEVVTAKVAAGVIEAPPEVTEGSSVMTARWPDVLSGIYSRDVHVLNRLSQPLTRSSKGTQGAAQIRGGTATDHGSQPSKGYPTGSRTCTTR